MYAPVAMRADNEAINFFASDDEGEGEGEEGEFCLLLLGSLGKGWSGEG